MKTQNKSQKLSTKNQNGKVFTLIELLVVIANHSNPRFNVITSIK